MPPPAVSTVRHQQSIRGGSLGCAASHGSRRDARWRRRRFPHRYAHCGNAADANALASLGPDGDRIKVLFFSVDPERDTPAALKSYMASAPRITALTGSTGELAAAAAAFGAHCAKVPGRHGSYTIDHTL